ncbi:MAG: TraB family protein [Candidatus Nanoarchaeia archaeon]|nr:TraB family protein [Candidatus Nanoarchaeia archaeon]MDD5587885.1 TraB family protein [Candidatus Nanoarchaeia archaeon]
MITYKNLTLIGTSHIAIQSIEEVKTIIREKKPEIVALELDKPRFQALLSKKKYKLRLRDIQRFGLKGFLFNFIGAFAEKKMGKLVGVTPGSEMRVAIREAREINAQIALIDQDISITLRRLSQKLTWKEKFRFIKDVIKSLFVREKINFDLKKVPDQKTIDKLTKNVKKQYPNFYLVLVDERNKYMAQNLYNLMQQDNSIIAIVGAGHEKEIINEIKKWEYLAKKR